jgi:hypothetical protein
MYVLEAHLRPSFIITDPRMWLRARYGWMDGWTDGMAYEIEIARAQAQQLL